MALQISRKYKSFLNGRSVNEGVRTTIGIIMPALVFGFAGSLKEGVIMSIGALCVSTTDGAGPIHHRKNAMLLCNLSIFLVSLLVNSVSGNHVLLALSLVLLSFVFSMLAIYGARAASLGLASMLIMVLNMEHPLYGLKLILNSLYILYGGVWYMSFTLILQRLRPYKLVQQALGDVIESTADYLFVRTLFYKPEVAYNKVYLQLMQKQATVQEQLASVSEILFKTRQLVKETTNTGRVLVMIFLEITDLFERLMTSYQQYEVLHQYFDGTIILSKLESVLAFLTDELREIGVAVKSGRTSTLKVESDQSVHELKNSFDQLRKELMTAENLDGFLAMGRIIESISDLRDKINVLHYYTSYGRKVLKKQEQINYEDFIVRQEIHLSTFYDSLNFGSNIFRHAIRVSVAVLIGYIVSLFFHIGHGYWILLTILVILKPAYTLTKQRNRDRILGTIAGILIGVIFLFTIKNVAVLLSVMIVLMTLSYIFLRTNYFISVLLMTPYLLIFFHLINPLDFKQIIFDRMIDTLIGSAIAYAANIFLVPSWEHTTLRMYMTRMLDTSIAYFEIISSVFVRENESLSEEYHAARKNVQVSLANLSDAFTRMMSEPKKYQQEASKVHRFVVLNHTLISHMATLSYYYNTSKQLYTSKNFEPVAHQTLTLLKEAKNVLDSGSTSLLSSDQKTALEILNKEANELLEKRKTEVTSGNYETETKLLLIRIKPISDQFNFIYSISNDIYKTAQTIHL